jgi:outer membrane protein assembly factor BamB
MLAGLLGLVNACASSRRDGPLNQERAWPVYLGSSARAGDGETLATDPQPVWRASLARGINGAPAITEDVVALTLADHRVALLERPTGVVLWTRRLGQAIGAGPLVSDDRVFVAEQTPGGRVYALRLTNGTTIWSARGGDVAAPLALADSSLYVGTVEGGVGRINPNTGVYAWRIRLPGAVRAALTPVRGGVIVATTTDSLFLLDEANGAVKIRRSVRGSVLAAPAIADTLLILGTSEGRLEAVSTTTLRTAWSAVLGVVIVGSVAVMAGRAYALTGRGTLVIVTLSAPGSARRVSTGIVTRGGPSPTSQGIYVSAVNGEIARVDTMGTIRWSARVEAPMVEPVLADGRTLIAVSARGDVVVFR